MTDRPKPKSCVMTIDPELATKWLEGNTHNRPVKDRVVREYTTEMKAMHWRLTGEAIIFDWNGVLLNGQHRLWACINSDTAFEAVVVTGVDPDTFTDIDQGSKRTAADAMFVAGPGKTKGINRNQLAATALLIHKYQTGTVFNNYKTPSSVLVELVAKEPSITEWVMRAGKARGALNGFATPVAATLFLGSAGFPNHAREFMDRFEDGINLDTGSPILALRARAMGQPPHITWERFYIVVQAWNFFVVGRAVHRLMTNSRIDEFPKIRGT